MAGRRGACARRACVGADGGGGGPLAATHAPSPVRHACTSSMMIAAQIMMGMGPAGGGWGCRGAGGARDVREGWSAGCGKAPLPCCPRTLRTPEEAQEQQDLVALAVGELVGAVLGEQLRGAGVGEAIVLVGLRGRRGGGWEVTRISAVAAVGRGWARAACCVRCPQAWQRVPRGPGVHPRVRRGEANPRLTASKMAFSAGLMLPPSFSCSSTSW